MKAFKGWKLFVICWVSTDAFSMFSEKQLSDWVRDDHIHNIAYLAFTGYVLLNWTSCTQHPQVNYKFLAVCVEYLLGCIK